MIKSTDPVHISFEIGPTIQGVGSAIELAHIAAKAGAQSLKAQLLDPDTLIGEDRPISWRDAVGEQQSESLRAILKRRVLTDEEWRSVCETAHARGLAFVATVDCPRTLELALKIGSDALKACSGDVNYLPWIAEMARAGLPLMLDTGNATLGEIEAAIDTAQSAGCGQLILHVVPSGYPARLESINLRMLITIQQMFPEVVPAFSDHSPGAMIDVAAVALGARLVEKTLTLSRSTWGPEHGFSLEPDEAPGFVQAIRYVEKAMGSPRRRIGPEERKGKAVARRSAFAKRPIAAGTQINEADIEYRRPGDGIEPGEARYLLGRRAARNMPAGQKITWGSVE